MDDTNPVQALENKYKEFLIIKQNFSLLEWLQHAELSCNQPISNDFVEMHASKTTNKDTVFNLLEDIGCLRDKHGQWTFPTGKLQKLIKTNFAKIL